jgi:hypothetical protein
MLITTGLRHASLGGIVALALVDHAAVLEPIRAPQRRGPEYAPSGYRNRGTGAGAARAFHRVLARQEFLRKFYANETSSEPSRQVRRAAKRYAAKRPAPVVRPQWRRPAGWGGR